MYAVIGGFHLSGPFFEPIIGRTTEELKALDPLYVVPTHCTGRKAIMGHHAHGARDAGQVHPQHVGDQADVRLRCTSSRTQPGCCRGGMNCG